MSLEECGCWQFTCTNCFPRYNAAKAARLAVIRELRKRADTEVNDASWTADHEHAWWLAQLDEMEKE